MKPMSTSAPSSRLVFKNLPPKCTEAHFRDALVTAPYKSGKNRISVEITDVSFLFQGRRFRGIAFVGFQTTEQATAAMHCWDKAYFGNLRLSVEYFKPQAKNESSFSAHGKNSLTNVEHLQRMEEQSKRRQEVAAALLMGKVPPKKNPQLTSTSDASTPQQQEYFQQRQKQRVLQALSMHPALFGLSEQERMKVISDPGFHEYIGAMLSKARSSGKLWDNDDSSGQTNVLRALSIAMTDGQGDKTKADDAISQPSAKIQSLGADSNNNQSAVTSYEDLMRQLQQQKHSASAKNKSNDSDDDDDYFSNPSFGDADNTKNKDLQAIVNAAKSNQSSSSLKRAKKFGTNKSLEQSTRGSDDDDDDEDDDDDDDKPLPVKKSPAAATSTAMSDTDFLKMAMSGFSSDEEEEQDESENDDDDDDDEDDENENTKDSNDDDDDDAVKSIAKKAKSSTKMTLDESILAHFATQDSKNEAQQTKDVDPVVETQFVQLDEANAERLLEESQFIFARNLPYTTTLEDLTALFEQYGTLRDVNLPVDALGNSKGFAYIFFVLAQDAIMAYKELSGSVFQGRLLHLIPGNLKAVPQKPELLDQYGEEELDNMSYKRKKELILKHTAEDGHNWNSLFISPQTIANATSAKLNIAKRDLLGADAAEDRDSAGVRLAVAEAHILAETKTFLEEYGVNLEKFNSTPNTADRFKKQQSKIGTATKSKTVILVKNIPFDITEHELRTMFKRFGQVNRVILPPYKTIAIIEYASPSAAKKGFAGMAYKRHRDTPLYLEWAPEGCLRNATETDNKGGVVAIADRSSGDAAFDDADAAQNEQPLDDANAAEQLESRTIFVNNLNFDSTESDLQQAIGALLPSAYQAYVKARHLEEQQQDLEHWSVRVTRIISTKVRSATGIHANKQVGQILSLGYGFIEFSHPQAAYWVAQQIHQIGGLILQGHKLNIRVCKRSDRKQLTNAFGSASLIPTAEDLKKKTILQQKGILSEEKLSQQQQWSQNNAKIIVRNIPFEATLQEVRSTFQSFAQVKRCTLPRKVGSTQRRGYAFVEFITPAEAQKAVEALRHVHLFGRHLALEWAKPDETVEELREKAKKSVS